MKYILKNSYTDNLYYGETIEDILNQVPGLKMDYSHGILYLNGEIIFRWIRGEYSLNELRKEFVQEATRLLLRKYRYVLYQQVEYPKPFFI